MRCVFVGHKPVQVIECRPVRRPKIYLHKKGGSKRADMREKYGTYKRCRYCGKKLSNFKRIY